MSYEKHPTYACAECHKSFKNERALNAHNEAKHAEPVQETEDRLAVSMDLSESDRGSDFVCDVNEAS
jgi:hypothetical protein